MFYFCCGEDSYESRLVFIGQIYGSCPQGQTENIEHEQLKLLHCGCNISIPPPWTLRPVLSCHLVLSDPRFTLNKTVSFLQRALLYSPQHLLHNGTASNHCKISSTLKRNNENFFFHNSSQRTLPLQRKSHFKRCSNSKESNLELKG